MRLNFYGPEAEWKALLIKAGIVEGWENEPTRWAIGRFPGTSEPQFVDIRVVTQCFPDGSSLTWTDKTTCIWCSDSEDLPMMQSARLIIEITEIAVRTMPYKRMRIKP